jgi:signal transduction histidine kinase
MSLTTLETVVRQLLASPEPVAIGIGPTLCALHNDAFAAMLGSTESRQARGGTLRDLCPALWPRLAPLVDQTLRSGERAVLGEQLLCRLQGGCPEEAYLRLACYALMGSDGTVGGVVVTLTDETARVIVARRVVALREIATAGTSSRSVLDGCQRTLHAVARHPSDVPFALVYLVAGDRHDVQLAAHAGVGIGTAATPERISLRFSDRAPGWPVAEVLDRNATVVVDDVVQRFGILPAGGWPFAPRAAVLVPLTMPGRDIPDGVLICGISARHRLDAAFRGFIDLVATHITAAMAVGRTHEDEARVERRRRVQLRALRAKFDGVLEERARLAREMHDTVLQGATGIALQLRALLPDVRTASEAAAEALQGIVELAERTSAEARQAVWDMRRIQRARWRDLARTLEISARRVIGVRPIRLRVSVVGRARPLDAHRLSAIIRVVQEATANAVRHADPRHIGLRLEFARHALRVAVVDDGRGFTVAEDFNTYEGHWGLVGMQERAHSLGGTLTVRSAPGRGTVVMLRLPRRTSQRQRRRAAG